MGNTRLTGEGTAPGSDLKQHLLRDAETTRAVQLAAVTCVLRRVPEHDQLMVLAALFQPVCRHVLGTQEQINEARRESRWGTP